MADEEPKVTELGNVLVELTGRYAGWWAEMDGDPSYGQMAVFDQPGLTPRLEVLAALIKRWNFQAKDGGPATTDLDGLKRIPLRAINPLVVAYSRTFAAELPNPSAAESSPTSSTDDDQPTSEPEQTSQSSS